MMMELTSSQRKVLSAAAHSLNPVMQVGKDCMSDGFIAKIEECLESHELIKVKFLCFKDEKKDLIEQLCDQVNCALVRIIGNIAILYRPSTNPDKQKHLI